MQPNELGELIETKFSQQNNTLNERGFVTVFHSARTAPGAILHRVQVSKNGKLYERFNDDSGGYYFDEHSWSLHMQVLQQMKEKQRLTWEWNKNIYHVSAEGYLYRELEHGVYEFIPVTPGEFRIQLGESFTRATKNRPKVLPEG